jgi:hypothetical protein
MRSGHFRVWAGMVGVATVAVLTWAGGSVASASTRTRSGVVHAQLASHVTGSAGTLSSGLAVRGSGIMAAVVAVLAVSSLAFLVVTFIRRRITPV